MSVEIAQKHWQTSQDFLWKMAEYFGKCQRDSTSTIEQLEKVLDFTFMGDLLWVVLPDAGDKVMMIVKEFAEQHDAEWIPANMSHTEWALRFKQRTDHKGVDWAFNENQSRLPEEPRTESNCERLVIKKKRWINCYEFLQSL